VADHDQSVAAPEAAAPEVARATPGAAEAVRLPTAAPGRAGGGAGNAALARFVSSGTGLRPGDGSQSLLRDLGGLGASNAALARLTGPGRVVARDETAEAPAPQQTDEDRKAEQAVKSKRTGPQPMFKLPGLGQILDVGLPHDKSVSHTWAANFNSGQKSLSVPVPLGPLRGEIGGSIGGAFDAKGNADVTWSREKGSVSPVGDRIDVNAGLNGKGRVDAAVFAKVGQDAFGLASAYAGGYGSLTVKGEGDAKVKGSVSRNADPEEMKFDAWNGGLDIDFKFSGKVLVSAGAFFEWKLFFLGGREEFFHVKDWEVGAMDIAGKGRLDVNGGNTFSIDKFDFSVGPPDPRRIHFKEGRQDSRNTHGPRPMYMKAMDGGDEDARRADARAAFAKIVARESAPPEAGAAPDGKDPAGAVPEPAADPAAAAPASAGGTGEVKAGAIDPGDFKKQAKALADQVRPAGGDGVEIGEPMIGEPPENQ
jgi:hypothetical protein